MENERHEIFGEKPKNYNYTTNVNFKCEIPAFPYLNQFIQSVTLPSLSVPEVSANYTNNDVFVSNNQIDFDILSMQIALDEDYKTYTLIYDWMVSFIDQDTFIHLVKDILVHILSANNKPILTFKYTDAFPTSLDSLPLLSNTSENEIITFGVSFRYQYIFQNYSSIM